MRRLALILVLSLGAPLLGGCALFARPKLNCKPCWKPEPCSGEWIPLKDGGCLLIVAEGVSCPKEDDNAGSR